ncbi:MAG: triacylglycerol lipase [Aliiglaciecola sp.]|uniref:lipase family alpha/beta hydrolase n=1 Tax=Aliiglaciecola sp. M165 TaxID=2593649 RepID=UPI00117F48AB|nr:triacylglycerol lipase [Aliiglaciecola sp. M165]TRY31544.1 triacylglycerol lipase [Aliiglaciecola sp. M165]
MKRLLLVISLMSLILSWSNAALAGTYAKTKYPIVLVHGLFGFDDILWADYFYKVPSKLANNGATVFVATVSPANSTEVRGEQLLAYVEDVIALTGAEKVNLIGHSHGGPTARYVASVAPELVASATSVAGVNWGSSVADLVRDKLPENSGLEAVAGTVTNAFTNFLELVSGSNPNNLPTDTIAALEALTTEKTLQFNSLYPEGMPTSYCANNGDLLADNDVYYFSWSGASTYTNVFDIADPVIAILGLAFNEPSDGLVSSCSSHLGYVLKDNYRMNHLDEVNQTFGIHHLFETDPVQVFLRHGNRLKQMGL